MLASCCPLHHPLRFGPLRRPRNAPHSRPSRCRSILPTLEKAVSAVVFSAIPRRQPITMATELEKKFKKAAWLIRNGPPQPNTSTEVKLKYYSLYKQATEGDVTGAQPWAVQFEARAKWDAWNEIKGMSKEEAMQKYVDLIASGGRNQEELGVLILIIKPGRDGLIGGGQLVLPCPCCR